MTSFAYYNSPKSRTEKSLKRKRQGSKQCPLRWLHHHHHHTRFLHLIILNKSKSKTLLWEFFLTKYAKFHLLQGSSRSSSKHYGDNDAIDPSSPSSYHRATKHLKYAGPGIVNASVRESEALSEETRKMKAMKKMGQSGKLWKWKRSHHQWLLQFKWKWQKPWKLSEWIKHNDETSMLFMSKTHDDIDDHSWNRHSMFQGA